MRGIEHELCPDLVRDRAERSVAAGEDARKGLLSVDGDVAALAEVIRVWLTRHRRWGSPVYLAGESYGTTRAAAMADTLQGMGVQLSGLILVSCAMDLQSLVFAHGNDLPYGLFLPAFANTAQYHGLLKGTLAASPEAASAGASVASAAAPPSPVLASGFASGACDFT